MIEIIIYPCRQYNFWYTEIAAQLL